jgi:hypothetical protein
MRMPHCGVRASGGVQCCGLGWRLGWGGGQRSGGAVPRPCVRLPTQLQPWCAATLDALNPQVQAGAGAGPSWAEGLLEGGRGSGRRMEIVPPSPLQTPAPSTAAADGWGPRRLWATTFQRQRVLPCAYWRLNMFSSPHSLCCRGAHGFVPPRVCTDPGPAGHSLGGRRLACGTRGVRSTAQSTRPIARTGAPAPRAPAGAR